MIFTFFPQPFIIGEWYRPKRLFARSKARGATHLFGYEADGGAATLDQWLAAAKEAGLLVYLQWSVVRPQDLLNPIVVGVMLDPDEPDGVGNTTAAAIIAEYAKVRAALVVAGRNLPTFLDFDGNKIPFNFPSVYQQYSQGCDIFGEDVYPENMGHGTAAAATDIPARVKSLQTAAPGKPIIAVIECSNQDLNKQSWTQANDATGTPLGPKMRGPTSDEFAAEVNSAVAAGVVGIVYFPDQIGNGWEGFDGTQPDVEARMTAVNATLATKTVTIPVPPLPVVTIPTTPAATTPKQWTCLRDLHHGRWIVQESGKPPHFLTDPADIAAMDALCASAK